MTKRVKFWAAMMLSVVLLGSVTRPAQAWSAAAAAASGGSAAAAAASAGGGYWSFGGR